MYYKDTVFSRKSASFNICTASFPLIPEIIKRNRHHEYLKQ